MTRAQKIELVETFLGCMASGDLESLPVTPGFSVETPLLPRCSGPEAMRYVRATAAATLRIRVEEHLVDGDRVATLSENETRHGRLPVFARFVLEEGRIVDARVFYDPRILLSSAR